MSETNYNDEQRKFQDMMPDYSNYDPYEYRIGFGRRLGAYLLDMIIIMIISMIALLLSGQLSELPAMADQLMNFQEGGAFEEWIMSIVPMTSILTLLYFSSEIFFGVTPGKLILSIKIGGDDRYPAPVSKLIARYVMKNISTILSLIGIYVAFAAFDIMGSILEIALYIGFLFTLAARRQGFHDMLSGTAVYYSNEILEKND